MGEGLKRKTAGPKKYARTFQGNGKPPASPHEPLITAIGIIKNNK
jgi:hypothetical protein